MHLCMLADIGGCSQREPGTSSYNKVQHTTAHYSTLQHTATCCTRHEVFNARQHSSTHCTTLQHTAPHCTTLHHTAPYCTTLHHTAPRHSAPHHTAIHYDTLQHTAHGTNPPTNFNTPQHTATHCNTLQHTAYGTTPSTHCNALQHTATHCNTLQHIATHCTWHESTTHDRSRGHMALHIIDASTHKTQHTSSACNRTHILIKKKHTRTYTRAYLHHFRERSAHTHIDSLSLTHQQGRGVGGGSGPKARCKNRIRQ